MSATKQVSREAIVRRYLNGETQNAIAQDLGVRRSTIAYHIEMGATIEQRETRRHAPRLETVLAAPAAPDLRAGKCVGVRWFTELGVEAQQAVCQECPVRIPCGEWGLEGPARVAGDDTVWGGMHPETRHKLQVRKRKQQQRAEVAA